MVLLRQAFRLCPPTRSVAMLAPMSSTVVNSKTCEIIRPDASLLGFLRYELGLTGVKAGCGEGACGACTVLVDGQPVLACQLPAGEAAGRAVTTIEGLAGSAGEPLHPVQRALIAERASQCGYCTPGIALRAAALLAAHPDPGDEQIAAALNPCLCRCGCYPRIVRAVHRAAVLAHGDDQSDPVPAETSPATHPPLARPARPWDMSAPGERDWFGVLGHGLVVVWPPPAAGPWPRSGGAWLHVAASGTVTAFTGKVDLGQDNLTALRLLVAEELAVDPAAVRLVQGDTDLCPYDAGTFGSRSMPDAGEALRRAAAGARAVLIDLAAPRLGGPHAYLRAERGSVVCGLTGIRLPYCALLAGAREVEVLAKEPPLTSPPDWTTAGHPYPAPRADAVTGARRFVSDLRRPGLRHGAVLPAPEPGAVLRSADTAAAEAMPGVKVVQDGEFIGVTADDPGTARRAVAAIRADWEQLPSGPSDLETYLRTHPAEGEGWQRAVSSQSGDPQAALAAAMTSVQATYTTAYLAHVPLETRAAVAEWENERLTVWTGTNVPFAVRARLSRTLGISEAAIRVIVPPVGGGFGGKHGDEAIEAARLARGAGRPVMVHWSRAEEFQQGFLRPMAVIDVRAGLDADGWITAWDFLDINAGASGFAFPYAVPNRRLRYQPAASPHAQGPYRALSATANTFARESHIDALAYAAGADPLRFRLRHLDDARLAAVVQAAAGRFGWCLGWQPAGRPAWQDGQWVWRGVGLAVGLEKGGRVATCTEALVDVAGQVRVTRIVTAYECGAVVNPDTVISQIEGGTVMALGGALFEAVTFEHGRVARPSLSGYRVPRFTDVPDLDVVLLDRPDLPSAGAGETPLIAVAPAIANAIFAATGRRFRSLPLLTEARVR
jgi:nicotinate dehydrogenase subunit B